MTQARPTRQFLQRVRIAHSADRWNSHRLSVRPWRSDCVLTNEDTIVQLSASGRTILLRVVSAEVKFIGIFTGDNVSIIH